MSFSRVLRRFVSIVAGALILFLVEGFLKSNLPAYRLPMGTKVGLVLSLLYFAFAGLAGGSVAKLVYKRAGIIESIIIGTWWPLLFFWGSRQISEHLPLMIASFFSLAAFLGTYAGTFVTKRFRTHKSTDL